MSSDRSGARSDAVIARLANNARWHGRCSNSERSARSDTLPWRGRVGEPRSGEPGWGELSTAASPHPDAHCVRVDPPPPGQGATEYVATKVHARSLDAPSKQFAQLRGDPDERLGFADREVAL